MKKIMIIILLLGIAMADLSGNYPKIENDGMASGFKLVGSSDKYFQIEGFGMEIATPDTAFIAVTVSNVLDFDGLDATVVATDGDSITEASIDWLMSDGSVSETSTLTLGTPITTYLSQALKIKILNPSADVVTIATLNIRGWND